MKLLLVAVTSLGLLVLGIALLYAGTGTLHLEEMAVATADPRGSGGPSRAGGLWVRSSPSAGMGYKVAALPFGLWAPDVYAGSPVPVAAFLSTVSKIAGLSGVALVLLVGLRGVVDDWTPWLAVLVVVTMTVGNLVAFAQRSAVRLLAWSTIAQAGWVLLPLTGLVPGGRDPAGAPLSAAVVYLLAYATATLVVFAVVVLVTRHHRDGAAPRARGLPRPRTARAGGRRTARPRSPQPGRAAPRCRGSRRQDRRDRPGRRRRALVAGGAGGAQRGVGPRLLPAMGRPARRPSGRLTGPARRATAADRAERRPRGRPGRTAGRLPVPTSSPPSPSPPSG